MAEEPASRLGVRTASALVLGAGAIALAWVGGWVFAMAVLAIALAMAWEWLRLTGAPAAWPLYLGLVAIWVAGATLPLWAAILVVIATTGILWIATRMAVAALGTGGPWVAAGALYVGVPVVAILWLRAVPDHGAWIVLWLFLVVWATDTGAFAAGRLIGGVKLAPTWSPRKTWSGAAGGLTGALAVSAVLVDIGMDVRPWHVLAAAGGVSILSQVGDLLESIIKRRFHHKDSGALIPGHGGILDRLDSMVTAAPGLACWVALAGGEAWLWRANDG